MGCSLPFSSRYVASSATEYLRAQLEDVANLDRRLKGERAAAFRAVSPSCDCRMSAKRASKSRPCSTPRRCQPVRFAPATNWPSRSASSATTSPAKPTGPERAGVGAEGRADLVLRREPDVAAEHRRELRLLEAVVAAHEGEHHRSVARRPASPSTSRRRRCPRNSARASIVAMPGVSTSLGRVEPLAETPAPAACRARSRDRLRSRRART